MRHMDSRQTFFIFILIFTTFLLYVANHCLNFKFRAFRRAIDLENTRGLPTIIIHSNYEESGSNPKCPSDNDSFPPIRTSKWQKLRSDSHLYFYSAYRDERVPGKNIRILAMSKGEYRSKPFCKIWCSKFHKIHFTTARVQELWVKSWDSPRSDQYYRPVLLTCPFLSDCDPHLVSILEHKCDEPHNVFMLNKSKSNRPKADFVVCVKPLHYHEDTSKDILEWTELQFILGADKIALYKHSAHPNTLKLLQSYLSSGKITITDYHPINNDTDSDEYFSNTWQKRRHEILVYNDCFYRHISSHHHVINIDLDEAILPLRHNSWKELLNHVKKKTPNIYKSASISVANVYFFDSFGTDTNADVKSDQFRMLSHLRRSANFTPPGFAQKSFFRTDLAESVANHYALRANRYGVGINTGISRSLAQLHHYRKACPTKMEKECADNYMKFKVRDEAMVRFKNRLVRNVKRKTEELFSNNATNATL